MSIRFNEVSKEFHLQSSESSYIFKILENGHLGHLYYGEKIQHRNSFVRFFHVEHRPNTNYEYENEQEFSLDIIKQEYPTFGTTDFREPAYQLLQENGSRITDFKYKKHEIIKGKKPLDGLPATYVENDDEATTLTVTLVDQKINVHMQLQYTVFEKFNAITRSVKFINQSTSEVNLTRVLSASVDFFDSNYEMIQLSGSWARERYIKNRLLIPGIQSINSTRGASSAQQNPFIALKRPDTNEHHGEVYGFSLVYSGSFLAQVEVDHYDVSRLMIGINPFDFNWLLKEGEEFQAPEVVMVYSNNGLNGMSQDYHDLYNQQLIYGKWRGKERPILLNNWEGTYFDFDEEKILEMATEAKDIGIELFVLDDGWFGKRDDDTTSLGDWYVDRRKIPNGINKLAEQITDKGLKFGLWFEPEMVSKKSELYKKHPDWIIRVPNRKMSHGRNQYILDFSRQEVVDYIYKSISEILHGNSISYIKWDMNRYISEAGSMNLPYNRQSEVVHRYILGVYQLYEKLTTEFPDVLFESCASGGARFDPGLLYYAPQTWTSDNTDAIERLKIQYGTSMVYPLSTIGAHVSDVPNHQVNRITSAETRFNVACFGVLGYELDVTKLTISEKEIMRDQIDFYKKNKKLIQYGDFYRLESPFVNQGNNTSWMVISEDKEQALVGYYQVLSLPNPGFKKIKLTGLCPEYEYSIDGIDDTFYGDELMNFGILLNRYQFKEDSGDYLSVLFKLQRRTDNSK